MTIIDKPGIYEIPVDDYFSDPCPEVSLSSSGIRTLLSATPAHFRAKNPRLSPWPIEDKHTKATDLGTVVHKLVLERGNDFVVVPGFDNWMTKTAKTVRDEIRASGKVPMLEKDYDDARVIADEAIAGLAARFGGWPIGKSEQTLVWFKDTPGGRIWKRALLDIWSPRAVTILDLKSTKKAIGDEDLARKFATEGGDIQAAHYLEGIAAVFPDFAGLAQFIFAPVEVEPPYAMRFARIGESWLTRARFRIERAESRFIDCLTSDQWPGWEADTVLTAPAYLETRWESEELEEAS